MSHVCRVVITALLVLGGSPATASARMLIYLDFDGHAESSYNGQSIAVAAYTGTSASRQEVLRRLREDFAPFDVTFITSDDLAPGELPPGIGQGYGAQDPAIRVAIGGSVGDLGASGLATDPYSSNVVWVAEYSGTTRRADREIANTAAHELGHAFGHLAAHVQPWPALKTASFISHYGARINPTDTNPFLQDSHYLVPHGKTEIMNGPRAAVRDIWWRDPNVAKGVRLGGNPEDPNLIRLVAGLAESGIVAGPSRGDVKPGWPLQRESSKPAVVLVTNALKQVSAVRVVAQVVAWSAMTKEEASKTYQRLAEVLARFDASR